MKVAPDDEEELLRSVALRNASAILSARQRVDDDLRRTRAELEARSDELARSLAVMQATLESTADAILVTDDAGRIETFNERFLEAWGLRREEVEGNDHAGLIRRVAHLFRDPEALAARIRAVYASGEEASDRLELTDGRCFERFSRPQSVGGRAVGRVWSYRDITERKRAEEALREEARVLDLLNQTGSAVASSLELPVLLQTVTDAGTQLTGAEYGAFFYESVDERGAAARLQTLSGLPVAAPEGAAADAATPLFAPAFDAGAPLRLDDALDDERYAAPALAHALSSGHGPVRSYLAVPVKARDGRTVGGLVFGHRQAGVFDTRSERIVVGIAGQAAIALANARIYEEARRVAEERERLVRTERTARAEIARVSQLKDEFLATLSHELRTPMSAILGWSTALRIKRTDDALERGLAAIARNATAQARLIDDLLDMNRIVSGKVRLEMRTVDPATVVGAAIDVVRPSAEAKGLTLRQRLEPAEGPVSADPDRLQQVVWNLLTNAVKFTPRGGHVDVALRRSGPAIEIVVRDDGIGIAAEFLPQVFDRFRQADASTTRLHGGLGLGLSIARQLVELHGGGVEAASDGLGAGATFVVRLPLAAETPALADPGAAPVAEAPAEPPVVVDLDGLSIVVVDDEPDARDLLVELLSGSGASVHPAASADEALAVWPAAGPHLLISDIGMPGRDGHQLIEAIRRLPRERGGEVPAIALTAFARPEDRARSMRAGYQVHLAKPVRAHELMAAIGGLTGRVARR